ncbi:sensor domain-containing diguanylate cyclase [Pseudodesulfovibrio portus]|uniref:diguanylate cyclase n=1 Tax=Pseudodesulfovibrio portus TaxID=231439 RepID=A0ABN6RU93_9BACT|nr:diguanylate cyclase [Pseudodesulfovibrio portus]BDQ33620.1 hypothetical protein JCM14722_11620 [Pseudodesulfovibrio portus]
MADKTTQQELQEALERIEELESDLASLDQQCFLQDIEQDKARAKLIRYERIISSTPDLIALVNKHHRFRMANDAFAASFEISQENVIDLHISDVLGKDLYESVIRARLDRALEGETVVVENWIDLPKQGKRFLATTYHPVIVEGTDIDYVAVDSRDMTELKIKEEDLQATARRLDLATDAGNIGIWERDFLTNRNYWDKKMYELYRVKPGEFDSIYEGWRSRIHQDDLPEVERKMAESVETKQRYEMEYQLTWPDGDVRIIRSAWTVQAGEDGSPVRMTGVNWDVTVHRRMENELRLLASTDPLTGASNRRHFMSRLEDELERCKRYGTRMVLLSLDIDHFKDINDTFGHPAGDVVLKDMVALCTRTLRTTDVFGRVGGEEFLAALTLTGLAAGQRTAERLRKGIEDLVVNVDGKSITFTISIGMTELLSTDQTIDPLLHRADEALYKAKNNGRNRIETV